MKDLITTEENTIEVKARKYLKTLGFKYSDDAADTFIEICRAYRLNPFKREIYGIEGWSRKDPKALTTIVGYEVYIKRADQTGKMDGWEKEIAFDKNGAPLSCTVTIYRKDWSHPFHHTAYFNETVRKKEDGTALSLWGSKPIFMLGKVAIAQAFRMCFPDEMGGLPYTMEEQESMTLTSCQPSGGADIPLEIEKEDVAPDLTVQQLRTLFMEATDIDNLLHLTQIYTDSVKKLAPEFQKELSDFCKNYKATLQKEASQPEF